LKRSVILMRAKDKKRREVDCDAEKQRSLDHDYASGRLAFERIQPLINEYEE
jgi:hypothetical protein